MQGTEAAFEEERQRHIATIDHLKDILRKRNDEITAIKSEHNNLENRFRMLEDEHRFQMIESDCKLREKDRRIALLERQLQIHQPKVENDVKPVVMVCAN